MSSPEASSQEDSLLKWIQYGIAFEFECLEHLLRATSDKLNLDKRDALLDTIHHKDVDVGSKARKTAQNQFNKENTVNESC